jgi:YbgC/YbaW family acyl-CoA thioester hydrolase
MTRVSEFLLHRRVQFYEVDSAGIVHFSWFFRYMEEAEHAMWRDAGLSIAMTGTDIGFPRVATSFDYHRPLRFEDEFDVRIQIAAIKAKSIQYSCLVTKGAERIATGALTIACVRKGPQHTMTGIPIPEEIVSRFAVAADRAV